MVRVYYHNLKMVALLLIVCVLANCNVLENKQHMHIKFCDGDHQMLGFHLRVMFYCQNIVTFILLQRFNVWFNCMYFCSCLPVIPFKYDWIFSSTWRLKVPLSSHAIEVGKLWKIIFKLLILLFLSCFIYHDGPYRM